MIDVQALLCRYHVTELRLWGKFRLETDGGELVIKPAEDDDD